MKMLKFVFVGAVLFALSVFAAKQKTATLWWQAQAGDSKQMIWIKPTKTSAAELALYQLDDNGKWKIVMQTKAKIGKNAFADYGQKTEADGKTPQGLFEVGAVYGRTPLFYLSLPYNQIDSESAWDVLPSDINLLIRYDEANSKANPKQALVIHDWGTKKAATANGSIAIDKESLLKLVTALKKDQNPKIALGTAPAGDVK